MDDCPPVVDLAGAVVLGARLYKLGSPAKSARWPYPHTPKASTTSALQSISTVAPSFEASDICLHRHQNKHHQPCLPRRPPPLLPRRRLLPPHPLMAHISVRISPRSAVAKRSRVSHRVRSPILTLSDRYGKGCYHQGQSMFPGASLPPHMGLQRLPNNMSARQHFASPRSPS
jgi:hypothetical protein